MPPVIGFGPRIWHQKRSWASRDAAKFHEGDQLAGGYRIHRILPELKEVVIRKGREIHRFRASDKPRMVDSWMGPVSAELKGEDEEKKGT